MKTCPFCAEPIQDAAIVCRYCGRDLPAAAREIPPPAATAKSNGPKRIVTIAAGAVLGLILVGVLRVRPGGDGAPPAVPVDPNNMSADALGDMIRDVDLPCPAVTRIMRQGETNGLILWSAACSGGESYAVGVAGNGSNRILECSVASRSIGVECFTVLR